MKYDTIIIGSGPGGYVAAIRAAQLGLKTAVVERERLGGICLNWGCIPTKSLLRSAEIYRDAVHAADYGVIASDVKADVRAMVQRSRGVAEGMSKGVAFLLKKNKIDMLPGFGKIKARGLVSVSLDGKEEDYSTSHIIIATGARSKDLPTMPQDHEKILGYRDALMLDKLPTSMVVVGSGAIGSEFAWYYLSLGVKVTLVEYLDRILPLEDEEVSKQMARSFKKNGMKVMISAEVTGVARAGNGCKVSVKTKKGEEILDCDLVLSAAGVVPNTEQLGLEELGVHVLDNGRIAVDAHYQTNIEGIHAIGDCVPGTALAHVASAEGIHCVEHIAGKDPEVIDYGNIPSCIYTDPEVASVGMTEKAAKEAGYDLRIGKFPYTASGKASAAGHKEGFVKLIFDKKYGELLGAHLVGHNVTEMIAGLVGARKLEMTGEALIKTVHPHPTMSEAIMEAAAAAYEEVIHL